jgi:hypothetical protein
MTFPLVLFALVLCNASIFLMSSRFLTKRPIDFVLVRQRCVSFLILSIVSCYTLLIAGAISPFICLKQADGSETMVKNPTIRCYAGLWNEKFPVFVSFLTLYAGIFPLVLLSLLVYNRKRLDEPAVMQYFGSFTRQYKLQLFWWEVVFLMKRALFVAVAALIPAHPGDSAPYFACIFLLFGYLAIEFVVNPFRRSMTSKRSAMWSLIAVLVLMSDGLVFKSYQSSEVTKYAWSIIMILLIFLALSTTLFSLFQWIKNKKRLQESNSAILSPTIEITDPLCLRKIEGIETVANIDISEVQKITITRKTAVSHPSSEIQIAATSTRSIF